MSSRSVRCCPAWWRSPAPATGLSVKDVTKSLSRVFAWTAKSRQPAHPRGVGADIRDSIFRSRKEVSISLRLTSRGHRSVDLDIGCSVFYKHAWIIHIFKTHLLD